MRPSVLLLTIALSACTGVANTTDKTAPVGAAVSAVPVQTLEGYHWRLSNAVDADSKRMDGLFGAAGKPLQLDFTNSRLNVSNACNAISGDYHVVDGHLDTKLLLQTMMACMDPSLQERESIIKSTLQNKPELRMSHGNSTPHMSLVSLNGQTLTFVGEPNAATRFVEPGATVFLEVEPQTAPCNAPAGSDMACLRARERHYNPNGLSSGTPGPWQPLQYPIEDFTAQRGVRYVLRLKRYAPKPSSAKSPPVYVLDTIIESGAAQPSS